MPRLPLILTIALLAPLHGEDMGVEKLRRLERPQLWLENGRPKVLYCAATGQNGDTFNVAIPLRATQTTHKTSANGSKPASRQAPHD